MFKIIDGDRLTEILDGFIFKKILTIPVENGRDYVLRGGEECVRKDSDTSGIEFFGIR